VKVTPSDNGIFYFFTDLKEWKAQVRQVMWATRPALAAAVGRACMDRHPVVDAEVFPAVLVRFSDDTQ